MPKVEHLRVFGCDAYAHVPKDERQKLDSKMRKCILLGYGQETKGYRLYDPNRGKVFHSRDVKFNESEKEKESEGKTEAETDDDPVYRIELDFSDKCETMIDSDNCTTEEPNIESVLRRSERERRPPDYYGVEANTVNMLQNEPACIDDVLQSPKKDK